MARNITSAFKTAITNKVVRPIMAVELDFSDGVLKMWNGYGDLTMTAGGSSKTFTGQGDLLGITGVEESSTLSMSGVTLTLAGIKSSLISTALSAGYTNRNGAIYFGLFDFNFFFINFFKFYFIFFNTIWSLFNLKHLNFFENFKTMTAMN